MFLDEKRLGPRPEPWPPQPPKPRLTPRQEKAMTAVILFNVVMLFLAPIGGATIVEALVAWLTG